MLGNAHFIVKKMKSIYSNEVGGCKAQLHFLDASQPLELQVLHHLKKAAPKVNCCLWIRQEKVWKQKRQYISTNNTNISVMDNRVDCSALRNTNSYFYQSPESQTLV